jgi:hypothetical protein
MKIVKSLSLMQEYGNENLFHHTCKNKRSAFGFRNVSLKTGIQIYGLK